MKSIKVTDLNKAVKAADGALRVFAPQGVAMGRATWYKVTGVNITESGRGYVQVVRTGGYPDSFAVAATDRVWVAS